MAIVIKPKAPAKPTPKPAKVATNAVEDTNEEPVKPVQLTAKVGKATVSKEYKDGTVVEQNHEFPVAPVEGPVAVVSMSMGLTRNLGNYESVKFSVSLSLPCAPNQEAVDHTFHTARGWVDSTVESVNQEITSQLN